VQQYVWARLSDMLLYNFYKKRPMITQFSNCSPKTPFLSDVQTLQKCKWYHPSETIFYLLPFLASEKL